jgi:mxaJ protein
VFVTRTDGISEIKSLDDPKLRDVKIGVQLVGDDGANTPPVHALNNRGIVNNVKGFTLYGNYIEPNPPARIIDAVAKKDVDVAVVWGPLAGYFANKQQGSLHITPVTPQIDLPYLPFVYDISVGVRRGEDELKTKIDEILDRRREDIDRILNEYHVPRADQAQPLTALAKEAK